jgi:hypothetical protein
MLQMKASNIVIINAQDVEYCTTAEIRIVENRSFITYVLHAINLAFKNPTYVISAVISLMNAISQTIYALIELRSLVQH